MAVSKDIKPHNILIDAKTDDAYIIDFGTATRLSQETQKLADPGSLEGTLAYMSPEQTGRMNRVIDRRTDFYSLGVTLYEVLTGVVPFTSTDVFELIHSHIARRPRPPHERDEHIPPLLSELVMTLLAKNAEDRYQSAHGLRADLVECLQKWRQDKLGSGFPLRRHDHSGDLQIRQKLYGREQEVHALLAAFERASHGAAELLLVTGYAGVGKSALVHEIHKALVHRNGYFSGGKFDQFSRKLPYAPIAQAVRSLLLQILGGSANTLHKWRQQLQEQLGNAGQILIELFPELELIIGPQPKIATLGPIETQNRFEVVFQRFMRVLASSEHPLVLFLDDLQWADPASLKLIQVVLTDPERGHLLVIGAYRDSEVDPAHLLNMMLGTLRSGGTTITELAVTPLLLGAVTELVSDTLGCSQSVATPLAEVLFEKTQGNPFFINQFLTSLHDDKLLFFDIPAATWRWDLAAIAACQVTDNVVEYMAGKLRRLAEQSQQTLTLAAFLGSQFDLQTLSVVSGKPPATLAAELWEPLREGLIVPLDSDYRLVYAEQKGDTGAAAQNLNVSYRFLHDRVQQAAYWLTDPGQRPALHLQIGRALLGLAPKLDELSSQRLVNLTTHLNQAVELIGEPSERLLLARLNLLAGRHSKAASAYVAAADYFRIGSAFVDEASWQADHELCFALSAEQVEAEYLTGDFDQAEALFETLLPRATTPLEQVHLYHRRIVLYATLGKNVEALDVGRTALAVVSIELPSDPQKVQESLFIEAAAVPHNLAGRPLAELLDAPAMTDPLSRAAMKLLMELVGPAFHVNPWLNQLLCVKLVNLSLLHGNAEESPFGYVSYGFFLAAAFHKYEEAYEFGRFALDLNERHGNPALYSKLSNVFAGFIYFLRQPMRGGLEYLSRGIQIGWESGDLLYVSYNYIQLNATQLLLGEELGAVRIETERYLLQLQRYPSSAFSACMTLIRQFAACLEGRTLSAQVLSDERFDEEVFIKQLADTGLMTALYWYHQLKLQLLFLFEDYSGAYALAGVAERLAVFAPGSLSSIEGAFFSCLAAASVIGKGEPGSDGPAREFLARHKGQIAALAASCPQNFQHKLRLIEAEEAKLADDDLLAMTLYDQALVGAQENELVHDEGLANELTAKFHLSRDRRKVASIYMSDAHYCYRRWGANTKATHLADNYRGLLLQLSEPAEDVHSSTSESKGGTLATRAFKGSLLDLATVMRSAQAISGEIVLERVLEKVLRIALSNAGAQRGCLLLQQDGQLLVDALITAEPDVVRQGLGVPLESSQDVAISIVQSVMRTGEHIVLGDASRDLRFLGDPYVVAHKPKSILCLALQHQGRTIGILYLENNHVRGAFTADRLELLRLLCAQAASAVDNALLYGRVQAVTDQLRRANHEQVEANQRLRAVTGQLQQSNRDLSEAYSRMQALTVELQQSNQGLSGANARLQVELSERVRAEQERMQLQEQVIRVQSARLAEMSTPVIPITEHIMVMPLIGTVDAERAQQVLEAALQATQGHRARVVIIDITGMKHVDTNAANSLINTATALRLLGAQAVLTGIRAEVAQTLVSLGVQLDGMVTLSTLQSGIQYALSRTGGATKWRG